MNITVNGIPMTLEEAQRYGLPIEDIKEIMPELSNELTQLYNLHDELQEKAEEYQSKCHRYEVSMINAMDRLGHILDKINDINPERIPSDIKEELGELMTELYEYEVSR